MGQPIKKFCILETLTLLTDADRSTVIIFSSSSVEVPWNCCGSGVEVPWKCRRSAVEVPSNCRWSANSQQTPATATDLPLLTPPLSRVGWSKTVRFINLRKKDPAFLKMANIRNRFFDRRSPRHPEVGVFQCHKHTYRQTSRLYHWPGPQGRISENIILTLKHLIKKARGLYGPFVIFWVMYIFSDIGFNHLSSKSRALWNQTFRWWGKGYIQITDGLPIARLVKSNYGVNLVFLEMRIWWKNT